LNAIAESLKAMMALSINKIYKAHYTLLNIECGQTALDELSSAFKFNDAVIRHMVLLQDGPVTEASMLIKKDESRGDEERRSRAADDDGETVVAGATPVAVDTSEAAN
jgi:small subunit ribosomal protein S6